MFDYCGYDLNSSQPTLPSMNSTDFQATHRYENCLGLLGPSTYYGLYGINSILYSYLGPDGQLFLFFTGKTPTELATNSKARMFSIFFPHFTWNMRIHINSHMISSFFAFGIFMVTISSYPVIYKPQSILLLIPRKSIS